MNSIPPALDFCLRLAKAHAAMVRRFDGRLGTHHGLAFGDFVILLHLHRAPGGKLRRVDLAEQVGVTASAVTRALIPLEKIGLVTRQPDPHDARVGYASLTKAGHRLLREAMESAEILSEGAVPSVAPSHLQALSALLTRIAAG